MDFNALRECSEHLVGGGLLRGEHHRIFFLCEQEKFALITLWNLQEVTERHKVLTLSRCHVMLQVLKIHSGEDKSFLILFHKAIASKR